MSVLPPQLSDNERRLCDRIDSLEDYIKALEAALREANQPSELDDKLEREFDHFSIVPFKAICGTDKPNQTTSQTPERVKCGICWQYWKEWEASRLSRVAAPLQQEYLRGLEDALRIVETKWATVSVGKVKAEYQSEYERLEIADAIKRLIAAAPLQQESEKK